MHCICQEVSKDFDIKAHVLKILEDRASLDTRPKNMDVDAFLRYACQGKVYEYTHSVTIVLFSAY